MAVIPQMPSPRRHSTDEPTSSTQTSTSDISDHVEEGFGDTRVDPAIVRPDIGGRVLHFIIKRNTPEEEVVTFKCTTSNALDRLQAPPANVSVGRGGGDIHVHVSMGDVQLWIFGDSKWTVGQEGDPHPVVGQGHVLSHREPRSSSLPTWVLPATLATFQSRKRQNLV